MLEKLLHVHLVHNIQTVFSFSCVQNWFLHKFMKSQNVILKLKICTEWLCQVCLKHLTLGDQRVNFLIFNFPADSVNKQRYLYCVILVYHGIQFGFFMIARILINIDQNIHLINWQNIKVLMEHEELHLVEFYWFFNGRH